MMRLIGSNIDFPVWDGGNMKDLANFLGALSSFTWMLMVSVPSAWALCKLGQIIYNATEE